MNEEVGFLDIHVVTGFPDLLSPLNESIPGKAQEKNIVTVHCHNIRNYATDKHMQIDDYPYGGGAGVILKPEPIFNCVEHVREKFDLDCPLIYTTPQGKPLTQKLATELSFRKQLFILCGHYKGIDERVKEQLVGEEISIGDYIITAGELAAMVIIDSAVRLIPGVINDIDSADTDSFQTGLLDYPHYTRPADYCGMKVPEILLSGDHARIDKWRYEKALQKTRARRKDLYKKYME
jgi:tRNA (guanine37-N1)-methyltransferase